MGVASMNIARNFKHVLDIYKEISDNKINYQKSMIYGWNCSTRDIVALARILDMEGTIDWDSFKYMGIPIFKKNFKVAHWMSIMDKMKIRIQAWRANWLNIAGKVVLMKSILISLSIYQNSIMLAPKYFINKMEGMLRRYKKIP